MYHELLSILSTTPFIQVFIRSTTTPIYGTSTTDNNNLTSFVHL